MSDSTNHPDNGASSSAATPRMTLAYRPPPGRVSRARSWVRQTVGPENVVRGLRSLLWVAPLTLLTWVYAEREQIVPPTPVTVPVEVVSTDPNYVVTLERPDNGRVMANLVGPKARVDAVKDRLEGRTNGPSAVRIDVSSRLGAGVHRILANRMADDPQFVANGVTVSGTQPEWVEVRIDPIVERARVQVVKDPQFPAVTATEFEPKEVTVRGPQSVLEKVVDGQFVAHATLTGRPELNNLTDQTRVELKNVTLTLPFGGRDVSIVERPTVTARVVFAQPHEYTFQYLPVLVASRSELFDRFAVQHDPTVKGVTVVGTKEKIDELTKPGAPVPKAVFEIPSDLAAGTHSAPLKYDLPPGVTVKDLGATGGPLSKMDFILTPRLANP